jgi:hypothetical protein
MEPDGLLTSSQEPATGLHSEPDKSSPHIYSIFLGSALILSNL